MSIFKTKTAKINKEDRDIYIIPKENFDSFSESILDLGQIDSKSNQIDALSVMFDLEGFTNFCKQIDPQLAVPEFLSKFLKWMFQQIKLELIIKEFDEGYETYASLPFMSKFMGDGLLFLWDTKNLNDEEIANIVISMLGICKSYKTKFIKEIEYDIVDAPKKLRCGIARGLIYSVGNGNDFVGPCINVSARLQKFNSLSFCFSRRGIDPKSMHEDIVNDFAIKKVDIRGIGETELVCVIKSEFDKLSPEEKKKFK
jgi:hypothetical protein